MFLVAGKMATHVMLLPPTPTDVAWIILILPYRQQHFVAHKAVLVQQTNCGDLIQGRTHGLCWTQYLIEGTLWQMMSPHITWGGQ
jgi:hypothetical protein